MTNDQASLPFPVPAHSYALSASPTALFPPLSPPPQPAPSLLAVLSCPPPPLGLLSSRSRCQSALPFSSLLPSPLPIPLAGG